MRCWRTFSLKPEDLLLEWNIILLQSWCFSFLAWMPYMYSSPSYPDYILADFQLYMNSVPSFSNIIMMLQFFPLECHTWIPPTPILITFLLIFSSLFSLSLMLMSLIFSYVWKISQSCWQSTNSFCPIEEHWYP